MTVHKKEGFKWLTHLSSMIKNSESFCLSNPPPTLASNSLNHGFLSDFHTATSDKWGHILPYCVAEDRETSLTIKN